MRRLFTALMFSAFSASAALPQSLAPIDTLFRALGLPEIIDIMHEESMGYGAELEADLFSGRGGATWQVLLGDIYDTARMQETVRNRLDSELAATDLEPMLSFFLSDMGRQIVRLEVSARRALLDESIEAASLDALARMVASDDPRFDLLQDYAEAGNLVENNVVGAMNSNYAFYNGLAEGGAFPENPSQEDILRDVWSQEDAIRADTEEWLYSYLALAYQPLSDDDLERYIAFFRSDAGAELNRAIFLAFDELFAATSLALGRSAAQFMAGEDL